MDLGSAGLRARDVGDVDRVLGVDRTAEIAAGEVLAALLRYAAERVLARLAEVHRDRQQLGLAAGVASRCGEAGDLRQRRVRRRGARLQRILGARVPGRKLVGSDGVGPAGLEHVRRRRELHVGVDQRAAADARGGDHGDVAHHPDVEQPAGVGLLVEEGARRLLGPLGEVVAAEAPAAFEHADAVAGFCQAAGGDAAAEARSDHDRVVGRLHRATLSLHADRMQPVPRLSR